jgi:hypothetical protein
MVAANNVTLTNNQYVAAGTLVQGGTVRVNLQVNARSGVTGSGSVFLQLADPGNPSGTSYLQEVFYGPGLYSLERRCAGARVRGATNNGANVTLELMTESDLGK